MFTEVYPKIGSKVDFVRQNLQSQDVERGSGMILAVCLDATKRLVVHVAPDHPEGTDQPQNFNVDISCLNPTDEFIKKFSDKLEEIKSVSSEGNGKVEAIVSEYNNRVTEIYTELLGQPVEI